MRDVCLCRGVPPVSRRAHRAPFAITSDGEVLVNLAMFDTAKELAVLLAAARRHDGEVFIGVVLSPAETAFVLNELHHASRDASSRLVGRRRRTKKKGRSGNKNMTNKENRVATSSRRQPSFP